MSKWRYLQLFYSPLVFNLQVWLVLKNLVLVDAVHFQRSSSLILKGWESWNLYFENYFKCHFFSILEDGLNIPIILHFSNFLANVSPQITEFYPAILFMATMWKLRSSIKLSIQCKSFLKKHSSVKLFTNLNNAELELLLKPKAVPSSMILLIHWYLASLLSTSRINLPFQDLPQPITTSSILITTISLSSTAVTITGF